MKLICIGRCFAFLVLFLFPCTACSLEIIAGPYLQNPTETSVTVMWITDKNCTSWVEYGTGESLDKKAYNSQHGLIDADQTIHKVTIPGLSAGDKFQYKACSKEIINFQAYKVKFGETVTSEIVSSRTLDTKVKNVSFVVLNDIHQKSQWFGTLLKYVEDKPYDLVFLNGDILNFLQNEKQIVTRLLNPCTKMFASKIPMIYIRGNHETRGRYARMLPRYLSTPNDKYYYSLDHGPIHFTIMDTGEDKDDSHPEYSGLVDFTSYLREQTEWLKQEIQSKSFKEASFRVVIMHIPPIRSRSGKFSEWKSLFEQGKIDMMICGHTHRYAIIEPKEEISNYPIIIGGGPKPERATVIRVDATDKELTVTMTRDNGEVVGTYCAKKK